MAKKGVKFIPTQKQLDFFRDATAKGLTLVEICKVIRISYDTYMRNEELFKAYVEEGRRLLEDFDPNIEAIEAALVKRAKGYKYEEEEVSETTGTGKDGVFVNLKTVTKRKKHMAPETKAAMFYLTNRHSGRWKLDKKDAATTGNSDTMKEIAELFKGLYEQR